MLESALDHPLVGLEEFRDVASQLGHDVDTLLQGVEIVSQVRLPTLEDCRRVLSRAEPSRRVLRAATFVDAIRNRVRLGQGMHDRGEAILFAEGELWPTDLPGIRRHLPIRVKATSVLTRIVPAGTQWDVSTRGADWGIDDMEELYSIVNVGTLILEPGASIVVRGNVFTLVCQRLVCRRAAGAAMDAAAYDIGILPTPFPAGKPDRPLHGISGGDGLPGRPAPPTAGVQMESSVLGPLALDGRREPLDGAPGEAGEIGGRGGHAQSGGATKLAEINIRGIDPDSGSITIYSQPGRGGEGGAGGRGGEGGAGAAGGNAYRTMSGTIAPGRGGDGGAGGNGGDGGHGGSGGISSNIYVCVPADQEHRIVRISRPGNPGVGGAGGDPGLGGRGAPGGHGIDSGRGVDGARDVDRAHSVEAAHDVDSVHGVDSVHDVDGFNGRDGLPGRAGTRGANGRDGHARPAPPIFLNERL